MSGSLYMKAYKRSSVRSLNDYSYNKAQNAHKQRSGGRVMTYEEFKEECYIIRNNALDTQRIELEIARLEASKSDLLAPETVDYSRDGSRTQRSTDEKAINTLDSIDRRRAALLQKLENLPEENKEIYNLIENEPRRAGFMLVRFFIFAESVKYIAKVSNVTPANAWNMIYKGLKSIYTKYTANHENTTPGAR